MLYVIFVNVETYGNKNNIEPHATNKEHVLSEAANSLRGNGVL